MHGTCINIIFVHVCFTRELFRYFIYLHKAGSVRNETLCMQHVVLGSISSISFHKQPFSM